MVNKGFYRESANLLERINMVPTKFFCKEWDIRTKRAQQVINLRGGIARDSDDYCAWGYAFYGDMEINAESEVENTKILYWVEFYQTLENIQKGNVTLKKLIECLREITRID